MDLREAIYKRRSIREYLEKPIDQEIFVELIDAAIQAPNAVNQQLCSFSIVRDRALLMDISRKAKAHMVTVTPLALMSHHFQQILNDPDFDIFYGRLHSSLFQPHRTSPGQSRIAHSPLKT